MSSISTTGRTGKDLISVIKGCPEYTKVWKEAEAEEIRKLFLGTDFYKNVNGLIASDRFDAIAVLIHDHGLPVPPRLIDQLRRMDLRKQCEFVRAFDMEAEIGDLVKKGLPEELSRTLAAQKLDLVVDAIRADMKTLGESLDDIYKTPPQEALNAAKKRIGEKETKALMSDLYVFVREEIERIKSSVDGSPLTPQAKKDIFGMADSLEELMQMMDPTSPGYDPERVAAQRGRFIKTMRYLGKHVDSVLSVKREEGDFERFYKFMIVSMTMGMQSASQSEEEGEAGGTTFLDYLKQIEKEMKQAGNGA